MSQQNKSWRKTFDPIAEAGFNPPLAIDPRYAEILAREDAARERRRQLKLARVAYRRLNPRRRRTNATPTETGPQERVCITCRNSMPVAMYSSSIVRGKAYAHKRCIRCRSTVYMRSATCKAKKKLINDLRDKPCCDCRQSFPPQVMDFVYTHGLKSFPITSAWTGRTRDSIRDEAKKCEVICPNCRMIRKIKVHHNVSLSPSRLAQLPPELRTSVDISRRLAELFPTTTAKSSDSQA